MKRKFTKYCLGVTGLGLLTAITVANFAAYAVLQKAGLR